jgi:hypothetical protein
VASGAWKGLTWSRVDDAFPCYVGKDYCQDFASLFSFGGGYLGFRMAMPSKATAADPNTQGEYAIVPVVSRDGVNWTRGLAIDTAVPDAAIVQVGEGPAGLIAVARSADAGLCGTEPIWIRGLWTSNDGLAWSKVNLASAFGGAAVYHVAAGEAGYIADGVAADGVTTMVWTSADARNWKPVTLPAQVLEANEADQATSFGAGFVVAAKDFHGCGSMPLQTNSVWQSPDGTAWTKSNISPATSTRPKSTEIYRVSASMLFAIQDVWPYSGNSWTNAYGSTRDGIIWTPTPGPKLTGDMRDVVAWGGRGLVVSWPSYYDDPEAPTPPMLVAINTDGTLTTLRQSGSAPMFPSKGGNFGAVALPNYALGPAGLLVTDGVDIWYGVPTS